jgi:hypothetical protein
MPSGGLVENHNRNQCITSTLGGRKFTVNTSSSTGDEPIHVHIGPTAHLHPTVLAVRHQSAD